VGHRAAHLPGQLASDGIGAIDHPGHQTPDHLRPLAERHLPPRPLSRDGAIEHGVDLCRRRQVALGHHRAVYRADRLLDVGVTPSHRSQILSEQRVRSQSGIR
jgi:hypothetical protein